SGWPFWNLETASGVLNCLVPLACRIGVRKKLVAPSSTSPASARRPSYASFHAVPNQDDRESTSACDAKCPREYYKSPEELVKPGGFPPGAGRSLRRRSWILGH